MILDLIVCIVIPCAHRSCLLVAGTRLAVLAAERVADDGHELAAADSRYSAVPAADYPAQIF